MLKYKQNEVFTMAWNTGIEARDSNLWRLIEQNERAAKKAYLKKVMPFISNNELEGFL